MIAYMQHASTYVTPTWSDCLSVGHMGEPSKTDEWITMPFGGGG